MTQFDLFTGTASDAPVFRVPPVTIWRDASFESPVVSAKFQAYWVALWTGNPGWSVFMLAWNGWDFCRIVWEISPSISSGGDTQIETVPCPTDRPFLGDIPLGLLRVYWCAASEFASEDDALQSLNSGEG